MRHLPQLDGLRCLAVVAVLASHTTELAGPDGPLGGIGPGGVWLFYVLSGYLITGILLDVRAAAEASGHPKSRAWVAFWARRALRIFPLYYAALLAAVALGVGEARGEWPWFAAYLGNVRMAWLRRGLFGIGHFWSLAVEEQFYLFWPPLVLWCPRALVARLGAAMVACGPAYRILATRLGANEVAATFPLPACLDGLGFGVLLAAGVRPGAWAAIVGLALAAAEPVAAGLDVAYSIRPGAGRFGYALLSWWLVAAAASGIGGIAGRVLSSAAARYLGRISYGIYVVHAPVIAVLWCGRQPRGHHAFAAVSAWSVLVASLSWRYFEGPINRLKDRVPYVARSRPGSSG